MSIIILVSTSSWLHGIMEWLGYVPTTLVSDVLKTCLPSGQAMDAIFSERKVNSSCESIAGNVANSWQLVLTNYLPSYPPASFLPYWFLYATGDVSIPEHVSSFGNIQVCHDVGNTDITGVYSLNVVVLVKDMNCTTAESSSTLTSKVPGYSWWVLCARIMNISDLTFPAVVSLCRIEWEAVDGFRAQRRSSPYLCCVATYNREKSATSTFTMDICPVCLVLVLCVGHLMRDSEFLVMGSWIVCAWSLCRGTCCTDLWPPIPLCVLITDSSIIFSMSSISRSVYHLWWRDCSSHWWCTPEPLFEYLLRRHNVFMVLLFITVFWNIFLLKHF